MTSQHSGCHSRCPEQQTYGIGAHGSNIPIAGISILPAAWVLSLNKKCITSLPDMSCRQLTKLCAAKTIQVHGSYLLWFSQPLERWFTLRLFALLFILVSCHFYGTEFIWGVFFNAKLSPCLCPYDTALCVISWQRFSMSVLEAAQFQWEAAIVTWKAF